jgi:uncharacterized protein YggE
VDACTVTVRGTAAVPARPDRVELSLTVTALERSAQAALAEVTGKADRLGQVLEALGIAREQWSTSGATVHRELVWEGNRQVDRGLRGRYQVIVRLTDPTLVGRLLEEAVGASGAEASGPWWRVDPANPANVEAARLAAANARRMAEAYADGLGLRVGEVIGLREPGTGLGPDQGFGFRPLAMAASGPGEAALDVQPGALDVTAIVEVTFRLEAV